MPKFSDASLSKLKTLHPTLRNILLISIEHFDFTVLETLRDKTTQNEYFKQKKTQLKYPYSKHNRSTLLDRDDMSDAVDIAPYPINWNNREEFTLLAGFIKGVFEAFKLSYIISNDLELVWGGDWDNDNDTDDNNFDDLVHFELRRKE